MQLFPFLVSIFLCTMRELDSVTSCTTESEVGLAVWIVCHGGRCRALCWATCFNILVTVAFFFLFFVNSARPLVGYTTVYVFCAGW